jgi:hypothetical protein
MPSLAHVTQVTSYFRPYSIEFSSLLGLSSCDPKSSGYMYVPGGGMHLNLES